MNITFIYDSSHIQEKAQMEYPFISLPFPARDLSSNCFVVIYMQSQSTNDYQSDTY